MIGRDIFLTRPTILFLYWLVTLVTDCYLLHPQCLPQMPGLKRGW